MAKKVKCCECDCLMQWALPQKITKDNYEYAKSCLDYAKRTGVCGITSKTKLKTHEQYCKYFEPIVLRADENHINDGKCEFLIDPETICQYTGLIDKNGKKIWENDILEGHLDDKFPEDVTREKVIWHESGWKTEEPGCNDKEYLDEFDTENFEVVGNVFDNPELLEV